MPALRRGLGNGAGTAASLFCLRFLIDNALPPRLADLLVAAGHDAVHVRAYDMHASSDDKILARAADEDRIVVSADSDFGTILASIEAGRPSSSSGNLTSLSPTTTLKGYSRFCRC